LENGNIKYLLEFQILAVIVPVDDGIPVVVVADNTPKKHPLQGKPRMRNIKHQQIIKNRAVSKQFQLRIIKS
jgi:hypothetical protein